MTVRPARQERRGPTRPVESERAQRLIETHTDDEVARLSEDPGFTISGSAILRVRAKSASGICLSITI